MDIARRLGGGVDAATLWPSYAPARRPIHRRFIYKGDTSTHAHGTDPGVALADQGELPWTHLGAWGGSRRRDPMAVLHAGPPPHSHLPFTPFDTCIHTPFTSPYKLLITASALLYLRLAWAITRYSFTSNLLCTSESSLSCPSPSALPTLLQYHCTTIAQYTISPLTPLLYTIHHPHLVLGISCKGRVWLGCGLLQVGIHTSHSHGNDVLFHSAAEPDFLIAILRQ